MSEHLIGPRLGSYIAIVSTGFTIQIGASADLMHRETDLRSMQQNRCNICAAPEDSFDVAVNQSKSDWVHRLNADLEVALNLNENISFAVTGRASFLSARAGVRNPANPAEKVPHLIENDSIDFNVKGVAKYKY